MNARELILRIKWLTASDWTEFIFHLCYDTDLAMGIPRIDSHSFVSRHKILVGVNEEKIQK